MTCDIGGGTTDLSVIWICREKVDGNKTKKPVSGNKSQTELTRNMKPVKKQGEKSNRSQNDESVKNADNVD